MSQHGIMTTEFVDMLQIKPPALRAPPPYPRRGAFNRSRKFPHLICRMLRKLGFNIRLNHTFREKRSTCGYKYAARTRAQRKVLKVETYVSHLDL